MTLSPLHATEQQIIALSKRQPPSTKPSILDHSVARGRSSCTISRNGSIRYWMPQPAKIWVSDKEFLGVSAIDRMEGPTYPLKIRRGTNMTQSTSIERLPELTWKPGSQFTDDEAEEHPLRKSSTRTWTISCPQYVGGASAAIEDMERFQKQYPGAHFDIENVSTHHEVALFKWVLILPDGKVTVKGHDCIRFSPAGKIVSLLTFNPAFPKS